jgi:hypothetical protein
MAHCPGGTSNIRNETEPNKAKSETKNHKLKFLDSLDVLDLICQV